MGNRERLEATIEARLPEDFDSVDTVYLWRQIAAHLADSIEAEGLLAKDSEESSTTYKCHVCGSIVPKSGHLCGGPNGFGGASGGNYGGNQFAIQAPKAKE